MHPAYRHNMEHSGDAHMGIKGLVPLQIGRIPCEQRLHKRRRIRRKQFVAERFHPAAKGFWKVYPGIFAAVDHFQLALHIAPQIQFHGGIAVKPLASAFRHRAQAYLSPNDIPRDRRRCFIIEIQDRPFLRRPLQNAHHQPLIALQHFGIIRHPGGNGNCLVRKSLPGSHMAPVVQPPQKKSRHCRAETDQRPVPGLPLQQKGQPQKDHKGRRNIRQPLYRQKILRQEGRTSKPDSRPCQLTHRYQPIWPESFLPPRM